MAAGELENAIRDRAEPSRLEDLRQKFSDVFSDFLTQLRPAIGEAAATKPNEAAPLDAAQARPVVAQMLTQLSEFDAIAAETLLTNRTILAPLFTPEHFAAFEKQVQDYAFGEAQTELEKSAREAGLL